MVSMKCPQLQLALFLITAWNAFVVPVDASRRFILGRLTSVASPQRFSWCARLAVTRCRVGLG